MTIADLAEALGISPVSVRHHLSALQAQNLVRATEVRHGARAGRPHLTYSLTETALERFPTKYMRLSERLLDELKSTLPPEAIERMFSRIAEEAVAEYAPRLKDKALNEKMDVLVEILGAEGFMAQWNKAGERIALTEYNCPYLRLGQRHPEVCAIDQSLIEQVLQANVEKTTCVLNGAERCVFVITPDENSLPVIQ
jgi:predicted ArsR family transcriptional regulator